MDPYTTAQANIAELASEHANAGSLNEATTRFRIIDRLLLDCLGWHTSDITTEEHYDRDYVDYSLGGGPRSYPRG